MKRFYSITLFITSLILLLSSCANPTRQLPSRPTQIVGHGQWIALPRAKLQVIADLAHAVQRQYITAELAYDAFTKQLIMLTGAQGLPAECYYSSSCHYTNFENALNLLSGMFVWTGTHWHAEIVNSSSAYKKDLVPPTIDSAELVPSNGSLVFDGNSNVLIDLASPQCIPEPIPSNVNPKTASFGGYVCHMSHTLRVWLYKFGSWSRVFPSRAGLPLSIVAGGYSSAYDPATHQMVLFGGSSGSTKLCSTCNGYLTNDTWLFNGTNWIEMHPNNHPAPREGAAMVYDKSTRKLLLFGGWGLSPNKYKVTRGHGGKLPAVVAYNDTWEWTGTNWVELHPKSYPLESSIPLGGYNAMTSGYVQPPRVLSAYDSALNAPVVLLEDGTANQNYLWEWTGTDWLGISTNWVPRLTLNGHYGGTLGHSTASNLEGGIISALTYDPSTNQLIAVGNTAYSVNTKNKSLPIYTWVFHMQELSPTTSSAK